MQNDEVRKCDFWGSSFLHFPFLTSTWTYFLENTQEPHLQGIPK